MLGISGALRDKKSVVIDASVKELATSSNYPLAIAPVMVYDKAGSHSRVESAKK